VSTLWTLHLRLKDFEGPLPLLLHLIERNELEVTRVSVAAVADQFLALVGTAGSMDLASTGEFVAAAARLLVMKSRALLNARTGSDPDIAGQDDAEALVHQIAEYSRFRAAARTIGLWLDGSAATYPRPVEITPSSAPPPALEINPKTLLRAAKRLLVEQRQSDADPDPWPNVVYTSLRHELLTEVRRLRSTTFTLLSKNAWHPLVVITMFLALLDAVRLTQLDMRQDVPFGPIAVSLPGTSAVDA
jgi:segregation and condensation protein A